MGLGFQQITPKLVRGYIQNLKDKNGMTAYDWAAQRPDDKGKAVAELLKNAK